MAHVHELHLWLVDNVPEYAEANRQFLFLSFGAEYFTEVVSKVLRHTSAEKSRCSSRSFTNTNKPFAMAENKIKLGDAWKDVATYTTFAFTAIRLSNIPPPFSEAVAVDVAYSVSVDRPSLTTWFDDMIRF